MTYKIYKFIGAFILLITNVTTTFAQVPYTRYELQEPGSQKFRIIYDVSATRAGDEYFYNGLRVGSDHEIHAVYDRATGTQLKWDISNERNAESPAVTDGRFLRIKLTHKVPENGEIRIRIDKTYKDPKSYSTKGNTITFDRSLGIKRNSVVLPKGYELTGVNYPSQVVTEPDGRIKVSFWNAGSAAVPYKVTARRLVSTNQNTSSNKKDQLVLTEAISTSQTPRAARLNYTFSERAMQDRDIVYFLQQPETHDFRLYHDYTETREGVNKYVNIVRAGSKAKNPSAYILDTGEQLSVETLRGNEISAKNIDIGHTPTRADEVVVIWFDAVKKGHSTRLRIEETYTDPNRYVLNGDELVWDRSFGRPSNTVVLPDGWYLTTSSIPATISETEDGKISLKFLNDRQSSIAVFIKAKRRTQSKK